MDTFLIHDDAVGHIGPVALYMAYMSTISQHFEPDGPGTRFPQLKNLYYGKIDEKDAEQALDEINTVIEELKGLPVDKIVWDPDDPDMETPEGYKTERDDSNAYIYFITYDNKNMSDLIKDFIETQVENGGILDLAAVDSMSTIINIIEKRKKEKEEALTE